MPQYITLPNGASFPILEGETPEQAVAAALQKYPEAFGFQPPTEAEAPKGGFGAAFKAGVQNIIGQGALTAGKAGLLDPKRAEQIAQEREAKARSIFKPTEESFLDAPVQNTLELLGGSAPYALAPLAAGAGAAALGAPAAVGAGAAGLASLAQFTGSNLERQMDAQGKSLEQTSGTAAVGAAIPQAALDVIGFRFIPGIGKLFGAAGEKVTVDTARQLAAQTAKQIAADYAKATGRAMTAEGLTETMQQVLERAQAQLSVTDPEARQEMLQSFFGGALLGGVLAPAGRAVERSQMTSQSKELQAEQVRRDSSAGSTAQPPTEPALLQEYAQLEAQLQQEPALKKPQAPKNATPAQQLAYRDALAQYEQRKAAQEQLVARFLELRERVGGKAAELSAQQQRQRMAAEADPRQMGPQFVQPAQQQIPGVEGAVNGAETPEAQALLASERERRAYGPEADAAMYEGLFDQAAEAGMPADQTTETPDELRTRLMRDQRGLAAQRDQLRTRAQSATTSQELAQLAQQDDQLYRYQQQVEQQLKELPGPTPAPDLQALNKKIKRLTQAVTKAKESGDIRTAAWAQEQLEELQRQQVQKPFTPGSFQQVGGKAESVDSFNQRVVGPEIGAAREARAAAVAQHQARLAPELAALVRIGQREDIAPAVAKARAELQGRREVEGMERAAAMNRAATEQGELFAEPSPTPEAVPEPTDELAQALGIRAPSMPQPGGMPVTRTVTPSRVSPEALQRLIARAKNSPNLAAEDRQLLDQVEANLPALAQRATEDVLDAARSVAEQGPKRLQFGKPTETAAQEELQRSGRLDTVADWLYRAAWGHQSPERRAEVAGLVQALEQGRGSETEATKEAQHRALTKDERRAMQGLTPGMVPGKQLTTSGRRGLMERAPTGPTQRAVQAEIPGVEPTATAFASFREFEEYLESAALVVLKRSQGDMLDTVQRITKLAAPLHKLADGLETRVAELLAKRQQLTDLNATERAAADRQNEAALALVQQAQAEVDEALAPYREALAKAQRELQTVLDEDARLGQEMAANVAQLEATVRDDEIKRGAASKTAQQKQSAALAEFSRAAQEVAAAKDRVAEYAPSLLDSSTPFGRFDLTRWAELVQGVETAQQRLSKATRDARRAMLGPIAVARADMPSQVFEDYLVQEAVLFEQRRNLSRRFGGLTAARNRAQRAFDAAQAAVEASPYYSGKRASADSIAALSRSMGRDAAENINKRMGAISALDAQIGTAATDARALRRAADALKRPDRTQQNIAADETRLQREKAQRRDAARVERDRMAQIRGGETTADREAITFERPFDATSESRNLKDLLERAQDPDVSIDDRRRATDALADMVVGIDREANEFARNTQIAIDKHLARLEKLQRLRTDSPGQVANIAETEARIARGLERLRKRAGATRERILTPDERRAAADRTLQETRGAPLDDYERGQVAGYPRGSNLAARARAGETLTDFELGQLDGFQQGRALGPASRRDTTGGGAFRTGSEESRAGELQASRKNPITEARGVPERDTAISKAEMKKANEEAARLKAMSPAERKKQVAEAAAVAKELAKKDKPAGRRSRVEAAIEDLYNDNVEADDAPLDFGVGDALFSAQRGDFYLERQTTPLSDAAVGEASLGRADMLLERLASEGSTPFVRELAQRLFPVAGDVRIQVLPEVLDRNGRRVEGVYRPGTNEVLVPKLDMSEEVVLHELTHAATMRQLEAAPETLTPEQRAARQELQQLFDEVAADPTFTGEYAQETLPEFVAELMSNEALRQKIDARGNVLQRIYRAILRMLGLRDTDSAQAVQAAYRLFAPAKPYASKYAGVASVLRGRFLGTDAEFNADIPERVREVTQRTIGRDLTLVDKIQAHIAGFRTAYIDRFDGIDKALRQGVARGLIPELQAFQTQYFLRFGEHRNQFVEQAASNGVPQLIKHGDGTFTIETPEGEHANLSKIAKILHDANVGNEQATEQLFTQYLAVLRAEQEGIGYEKLNFSQPLTAADAAEIKRTVAADPARKRAFEAARAMYREYNHKLLDFMQQTDALSKDEVARLKAREYVPYYRNRGGIVELVVGSEQPVRIGNIVDQPYLKELVGDDAKILPFFTGALQNTSMLIDMALRNQQTKDVAMTLRKMDVATIGRGDGPTDTRDIVRFKVNGERMFARIENSVEEFGVNAELLVKGMEGIKTTLPTFLRALQIPANWLRKMVTRAPAYAVRQIIREPINAWLVSGANFTPVVSSVRELTKIMQGKSAAELALQRSGAISSNVITGDVQDQVRILRDISDGKTTFDKVMAAADKFAMQGDAATRAVLYDTYRKQGMTHMQALLGSLESMNFARRGVSPSMHMMSQLIPFFNAQVQGMDVIYRALSGNAPLEQQMNVRRQLFKRGMMVAAATVAYAAAMQDDEAYKNATPEQRALNWFLPLPGLDEPVRVPIPFELGYLFKVLPETIINVAAGDQKVGDAVKLYAGLLHQTVPFGIPQAVKPAIEVMTNHSFFTGEAVETGRERSLQTEERMRQNTTEVAKLLGQAGVLSPVQVDHLIRGYFGGLGVAMASIPNFALRPLNTQDMPELPEKTLSQMPLLGPLFQPRDGRASINAAYDEIESWQQAHNTFQNLLATGRRADAAKFAQDYSRDIALNSVGGAFKQQMGELAKLRRAVTAGPGTPEEKRRQIDAIKQIEIRLSQRMVQLGQGA